LIRALVIVGGNDILVCGTDTAEPFLRAYLFMRKRRGEVIGEGAA
jgi:hypothetical protein